MVSPVKRLRDAEAEWMTRATSSAIEGAREALSSINGRAMISSLSELEWGWLAMGAVFNWIKCKSEQAVAEGIGYDEAIRAMDCVPAPWEVGAVTSILPALGETKGIDWNKPVGEWSGDQIVLFAWNVHQLIGTALAARDAGAEDKLTQPSQAVVERELSAKGGGPLMSRKELDDGDIPF